MQVSTHGGHVLDLHVFISFCTRCQGLLQSVWSDGNLALPVHKTKDSLIVLQTTITSLRLQSTSCASSGRTWVHKDVGGHHSCLCEVCP